MWERKRWIFPGRILESVCIFISVSISSLLNNQNAGKTFAWGYFMTENTWNCFLESSDSHPPHKYTSKVPNRRSNSSGQGVCRNPGSLHIAQTIVPKSGVFISRWSLSSGPLPQLLSPLLTHLRVPSASHPHRHSSFTSLPVLFKSCSQDRNCHRLLCTKV